MPRCPACSDLLFRRRIEGIETDGCPSCGGVWLDKGELHQLAKSSEALRTLARTFVPGTPRAVQKPNGMCPRCEEPLKPFEFDQFRGVRLDRCKKCGGMWLDHGEASAIADRLERGNEPVAPGSPTPAAADPSSGLELATQSSGLELATESSGLELATEPSPAALRAQAVVGIRGPVAAATALVHEPRPHRGATLAGAFWDSLRQADALIIQQQFELAELFGFETRNKYAIRADACTLGFAAEQGGDFFSFLFRQFLGHWRTFEITLFDSMRQPVLRALHPFRFLFQRLEVSLADGTFLGVIQQRWSFFSKRFDVLAADGRIIMTVDSPLWRLWTFPFRRGGQELAVVQKRWTGLFAEAFTDKDSFLVKLGNDLSDTERALVLVAGIFIDLQYFEQKAR